jgi:hypothetical protein
MLDLAIAIDADSKGKTTVETNHGETFVSQAWPLDCDFQLISFHPKSRTIEIISPELLAGDISKALQELDKFFVSQNERPDWYRRLTSCAEGT